LPCCSVWTAKLVIFAAKIHGLSSFDHIDLSEYTYTLPDDRIALYPTADRSQSRLLVRGIDGQISSSSFRNLPELLPEGSHLVMNNSRVIPARLIFHNSNGARVELFLLSPLNPVVYEEALASRSFSEWECMAGNLKRFTGDVLTMELEGPDSIFHLQAEKRSREGNLVQIRFAWDDDMVTFSEVLSLAGKTPLPPYIRREPVETDRDRYQTVYSGPGGSVAAPTAGLHFTPDILQELQKKGIRLHEVTLHVGAGTFQPIKASRVEHHPMHAEFIRVSRAFIRQLRTLDCQVTAVGTTSVRTLESLYWLGVKKIASPHGRSNAEHLEQWDAYRLPQDIPVSEALDALNEVAGGVETDALVTHTRLMIVPGYRFRMVNTLITNFHQPGSTLLLLIAAFMGPDWKRVYRYALDNGYRFLSYGDSSLLFR
jgi:S-adenosylmethionine:tRNA ribosyltransferase-isomerase